MWDYHGHKVTIVMPTYIQNTLKQFNYPHPNKPQHSPHRWQQQVYGEKVQLEKQPDTSPTVDDQKKKTIQQIIGTLMFYARAVDPTLLVALSTLSTQQAKPTQQTWKDILQLLNYCATHPNAEIQYRKIDMVLKGHRDSSFMSEPQARIRMGVHFYVDSINHMNKVNGPIINMAKIIQAVVESETEEEYGSLYMNSKASAPMQQTLEELVFKKPPTILITDSTTASGIANDDIKQKHS